MPNTQYAPYPAGDWSGEISPPQLSNHAHSTTSTTTTTTSSTSAGVQGSPAPITTTVTDTDYDVPAAGGVSVASEAPVASGVAAASGAPAASRAPSAARNEFEGSSGALDLGNHQPIEVIESPASMNEAFLGSLKSMLHRNRGNFVTATFLMGTQGSTIWEGILYEVGNDYIVIFQPARQRYIACDIYSLKYIEFYDTRQREMCQQLLRENGLL